MPRKQEGSWAIRLALQKIMPAYGLPRRISLLKGFFKAGAGFFKAGAGFFGRSRIFWPEPV